MILPWLKRKPRAITLLRLLHRRFIGGDAAPDNGHGSGVRKQFNGLLGLGELKAGYGAGYHILLNLHEVAVGTRHAEDREEPRAVRHEHSDA